MQSAGVEDEGREEDSRQEEKDSNLQDGSSNPMEKYGATVPPAQEGSSQDQSGPEADEPQLHHDTRVQENVSQASTTPHLLNLNISDEMDERENQPAEEEELIVLDPDHPLVQRMQAALNSYYTKKLEILNLELKENRALVKAQDDSMKEMHVEMFRMQEKLAGVQVKLEDCHHSKAQAAVRHQQKQDEREEIRRKYSSTVSRERKAKAKVSQLQEELDKLMMQLVFIQGVSEDLHSNAKAMQNMRSKAGAEKKQIEEQKLQQDLYVEHLTKKMEGLTQEIDVYEAQTRSQAEATQATKEALAEAEMELDSVLAEQKQLQQQWSASLVQLRRNDEALSAMQEAQRAAKQRLILLDREIEGNNKSITGEQEKNETLTMQFNLAQMDCTTTKKLIGEKQAEQEALQVQCSSCLRSLRQTEHTLARITKEANTYQTQLNDQSRQLEKESALHLELEEKIMTQMQQALTHNQGAAYSQRHISRMTTLKKEEMFQLWQLKNSIADVKLECSKANQHLDSLDLNLEGLNEEFTAHNKLLTSKQTQISSFYTIIEQKQHVITSLMKKLDQIAARTGHEDLSPLKIKEHALTTEIEEQHCKIKSGKQLWMMRQETIVGLMQHREANSKEAFKLQTESTVLQQRSIRLESQIEAERREDKELERNTKRLRADLLKLNTLLSKNHQLSLMLEQENALMEADVLRRLQEAERESVEMELRLEGSQEEKQRLLNSVMEAEFHVMLWEKKIQLLKETRTTVEASQEDIQLMRAEIHRMERRHNQLMKQREQLLKESEATVARLETIDLRMTAMKPYGSQKQMSKGKLDLTIQGLKRKICETNKTAVEYDQKIRALQQRKVSTNDRLVQQRQQLMAHRSTSSSTECEIVHLQEAKERNLMYLVALQNRNKTMQVVVQGTFRPLSSKETIDSLLQRKLERVNAVNNVLQSMCEEYPQYKEALLRPLRALEVRMQALKKETPKS